MEYLTTFDHHQIIVGQLAVAIAWLPTLRRINDNKWLQLLICIEAFFQIELTKGDPKAPGTSSLPLTLHVFSLNGQIYLIAFDLHCLECQAPVRQTPMCKARQMGEKGKMWLELAYTHSRHMLCFFSKNHFCRCFLFWRCFFSKPCQKKKKKKKTSQVLVAKMIFDCWMQLM